MYESIIYLQPTSPLRTVNDINKAIKLFYKKKANAVVSLTETKPKFWYKSISQNGSLISNKDDKKKIIFSTGLYIFLKQIFYNHQDIILMIKKHLLM